MARIIASELVSKLVEIGAIDSNPTDSNFIDSSKVLVVSGKVICNYIIVLEDKISLWDNDELIDESTPSEFIAVDSYLPLL